MASRVNSFNPPAEIPIMILTDQIFDCVCYVIFRDTLLKPEIFFHDEIGEGKDKNFKTYYQIEYDFQIIVKRPPEPLSDWYLRVFGFFEDKKIYEKEIKIERLFRLYLEGNYYYCWELFEDSYSN